VSIHTGTGRSRMVGFACEYFWQCFGPESALDPYSAASGIQIQDRYSKCGSRIRIQRFSFYFFQFLQEVALAHKHLNALIRYRYLKKVFLKITYGLAARYCCCELSEKTAVKKIWLEKDLEPGSGSRIWDQESGIHI